MRTDSHRGLLGGRTPAEVAELVEAATRIGLSFVDGSARDGRVLRHAEPAELIERFAGPLPELGATDQELLDLLAEVAAWSVAQGDERYLAFPDTGDSVANLVAAVVATMLNQNLIAFDRSAPAGSVIEAQVISWLRELIGYPVKPLREYSGLDGLGGMWTSGGNMSNHVAVAAALAATHPSVRENGLVGMASRPVIVLATGVEHFSYRAAAQVLGLGTRGLVGAAPTSAFTTDAAAIDAVLANPPAGTSPFMVVGVAGNCRTTGIDDLEALADVCAAHGVWFHVDACHGGSLLFSERLKGRLHGIERADSVSLDPHKGLFVSYPASYALFKDPAALTAFARYPDRMTDPGCLDLGLATPFYGSRGFDSLRMWSVLRHLGRAGVADLVEARHETFADMVALLRDTGLFAILDPADFYRCAFVFCPPAARDLVDALAPDPGLRGAVRAALSAATTGFCERLYRSGEVVFDLFSLQDLNDVLGLGTGDKYQVMGMCVGHPLIERATKDAIAARLRDTAEEVLPALLTRLRALAGVTTPLEQPGGDAPSMSPAGW